MTGLIIVALLVVVALAAPRYGADSHTSDSWTGERRGERAMPRSRATIRGDLTTAWSALVRRTGRARA
ncbi:hypothetical protein [Pseudonocardia humida]|uniref:Secreted protein n=1 Tax=Pseudonocardia humida TaxID=2800819 RepID=A0ABT1A413_9PSEU|nr:hypothetical protein [Pseudonocardia humida]MCO1657747.1 hypothetical protein [Pseudonocardia humida]